MLQEVTEKLNIASTTMKHFLLQFRKTAQNMIKADAQDVREIWLTQESKANAGKQTHRVEILVIMEIFF